MTRADELAARAQARVKEVAEGLPPDLRARAARVPVRCTWEVDAHWLAEGVAADSLGLFSGPSLADPLDPDCLESPLITLFVGELWAYCEGDLEAFDEEVRLTYLHEFGHYLGLEEDDLEARGLL